MAPKIDDEVLVWKEEACSHRENVVEKEPGLSKVTVGLKHKALRFATSWLPVDERRRGECNRCGECCKLPLPCPFLRYDEQGLSLCTVYHARPPSCRKYPRTPDENITPATCGFFFDDEIAGNPGYAEAACSNDNIDSVTA
ncbi:hypothetical protein [Thiorhodovibrio frisius]|uniref:Fe-S oxidoreductase n=1 Tax=Thiorhodovibrio frisius TaxID=631362 RepID=H8YXM2_9GAMM|nr:hypothetical protein [Thiorhodovibrio frisius]EIC23198.1 hypothetical protein Thi970DRAFT_00854 [Thiorhodovibrio frisius]WPL23725.1 hypothetical protein Thiofri_03928 [Thiorhodovibrio frisius]